MQVKLACFERCIPTEDRADGALRGDLLEWLQLVRPAPEPAPSSTTTDTITDTNPGVCAATAHPTTATIVPVSVPAVCAGASLPSIAAPAAVNTPNTTIASVQQRRGLRGISFNLTSLMARFAPASRSKPKVTDCTDGGSVRSVVSAGCEGADTTSALPMVVPEQSVVVCAPLQHTCTVFANATAPSADTYVLANTSASSPVTLPLSEPPLPKFTTMPALLLSQLKLPTLKIPSVSVVAALLQPKLAEFAEMSMSKVDSVVHAWRAKQQKNSEIVPNLQNKRLAMMALHSLKGIRRSTFGGVYRAALRADKEVSNDVVGNISIEGTGEKI